MKKTFYLIPVGVLVAGLSVAGLASTISGNFVLPNLQANIVEVGKEHGAAPVNSAHGDTAIEAIDTHQEEVLDATKEVATCGVEAVHKEEKKKPTSASTKSAKKKISTKKKK